MPNLETQGISLYYQLHGEREKPPVMLLAGLGGTGESWGSQIGRFAAEHFVIVPDHRGTGRSTHTSEGLTIAQHASDMASLLKHLGVGPAHLVGSSTGGAIAQVMSLDHAGVVASVAMTSSFAAADPYLRREFALRRQLMESADLRSVYECYALFLFAPHYAAQHPDVVDAWIERTAARPADRELAVKRIDMILAHDVVSRLGEIRRPALVMVGDADLCTPKHLSQQIVDGVPDAEFVIVPNGGHFINDEQPEVYFDTLCRFIDRRPAARAVART